MAVKFNADKLLHLFLSKIQILLFLKQDYKEETTPMLMLLMRHKCNFNMNFLVET